MIEFRDRFNRY